MGWLALVCPSSPPTRRCRHAGEVLLLGACDSGDRGGVTGNEHPGVCVSLPPGIAGQERRSAQKAAVRVARSGGLGAWGRLPRSPQVPPPLGWHWVAEELTRDMLRPVGLHPKASLACDASEHLALLFCAGELSPTLGKDPPRHTAPALHIEQAKNSEYSTQKILLCPQHCCPSSPCPMSGPERSSPTSGIPQLCCPGFVGIQDPVPRISLGPSYNYAAFPASCNLIAPLLLFDVSTRSVAAAQTWLLFCRQDESPCTH